MEASEAVSKSLSPRCQDSAPILTRAIPEAVAAAQTMPHQEVTLEVIPRQTLISLLLLLLKNGEQPLPTLNNTNL